jgi:hypothetical protein
VTARDRFFSETNCSMQAGKLLFSKSFGPCDLAAACILETDVNSATAAATLTSYTTGSNFFAVKDFKCSRSSGRHSRETSPPPVTITSSAPTTTPLTSPTAGPRVTLAEHARCTFNVEWTNDGTFRMLRYHLEDPDMRIGKALFIAGEPNMLTKIHMADP